MRTQFSDKPLKSAQIKKMGKGFHSNQNGGNRRTRRAKDQKDKPGKLYVIGKTKFRTKEQVIWRRFLTVNRKGHAVPRKSQKDKIVGYETIEPKRILHYT